MLTYNREHSRIDSPDGRFVGVYTITDTQGRDVDYVSLYDLAALLSVDRNSVPNFSKNRNHLCYSVRPPGHQGRSLICILASDVGRFEAFIVDERARNRVRPVVFAVGGGK